MVYVLAFLLLGVVFTIPNLQTTGFKILFNFLFSSIFLTSSSIQKPLTKYSPGVLSNLSICRKVFFFFL